MTGRTRVLPLLIVRPQPDAAATENRAIARKLRPIVLPLFQTVPLEWQPPDADDFDALLLTSKNAISYAGDIAAYRYLPVLAVGEATARAAREGHMDVVYCGQGGLADIIASPFWPRYPRILWFSALNHSALPPSANQVTVLPVYRLVQQSWQSTHLSMLDQPIVIALHSAAVAAAVAGEFERLDLDRTKAKLAVFSNGVARAAGTGWADVAVAADPTDDALLDAAHALCNGD